jgi:hypothetical protein
MALFAFTATTAAGAFVGEVVARDVAEARELAQGLVGEFPVRRVFEAPPKLGTSAEPSVTLLSLPRFRRACPWIDDKPQRRS